MSIDSSTPQYPKSKTLSESRVAPSGGAGCALCVVLAFCSRHPNNVTTWRRRSTLPSKSATGDQGRPAGRVRKERSAVHENSLFLFYVRASLFVVHGTQTLFTRDTNYYGHCSHYNAQQTRQRIPQEEAPARGGEYTMMQNAKCGLRAPPMSPHAPITRRRPSPPSARAGGWRSRGRKSSASA
eukprot:scaffold12893_cov94-Isochrysis_galbana.AAC.6